MKNLLAIAALLAVCAVAPADCRRVVRVQQVVAVDHVAPIAAVFAVPAYSVSYAPNGQDVSALVAEIKALRSEVQAMRAAPQQAMPPAKEEPKQAATTHLKVFAAKCASCHDKAIAGAKGGGFALLDNGGISALTHAQALRVAGRVYAGEMPPKAPLNDEEVGAVMAWINSIK